MVGLALFGVASCIIAAAGTQTELLAGRALQGLAAALAVPGTLAAVDTSAAAERRGAAIGAWTGFLMLGFSIGPLLGGALTGTGATAPDRRFANGMLAFYVDPKVIDTANFFDGDIARYVDFIRATKPVAGIEQVLVPGDPERKTRVERSRNGVPLPDDTWAAIVNTAREVGVSEISIQRATS